MLHRICLIILDKLFYFVSSSTFILQFLNPLLLKVIDLPWVNLRDYFISSCSVKVNFENLLSYTWFNYVLLVAALLKILRHLTVIQLLVVYFTTSLLFIDLICIAGLVAHLLLSFSLYV